jgi:hypothetical protein
MNKENPLWGAPRIHGELLKPGLQVAQSTVAKYMVKRRGPPSQGWCTFLRNQAPDIGAIDMFVVPTIGIKLLHGIVIMRRGPATPGVDQRHRESGRRMDRAPDHRGIPLGSGPALSPWGSRQVIRGNRPSPIASHGDP